MPSAWSHEFVESLIVLAKSLITWDCQELSHMSYCTCKNSCDQPLFQFSLAVLLYQTWMPATAVVQQSSLFALYNLCTSSSIQVFWELCCSSRCTVNSFTACFSMALLILQLWFQRSLELLAYSCMTINWKCKFIMTVEFHHFYGVQVPSVYASLISFFLLPNQHGVMLIFSAIYHHQFTSWVADLCSLSACVSYPLST